MTILGISAYYHDAAAAIIVDGVVVAAAAEERFSRKKHDRDFPRRAIVYCLQEAGVAPADVDTVVFYEKPFLKFERLLMTHIHCAPRSLKLFLKTMPIWLKERVNMTRTLTRRLNEALSCHRRWDIRYVEHHLSHAALAFHASGFSRAAVLVIDAVGEHATTSIMCADPQGIHIFKEQHFPDSVGLLYSSFTYFLGFRVNADEYKVMGLAPYGSLRDAQTQRFIDIICRQLVDVADDGSIHLNLKHFTFTHSFEMVNLRHWERLFGIDRRAPQTPIQLCHANLAAAIQHVTTIIVRRLVRHARALTGATRLCLAGGCALNCAVMGNVKSSGVFDDVFVPFAPGDDGAAIGAAMYFSKLAAPSTPLSPLSPYLGPVYSDDDVLRSLHDYPALRHEKLSDNELYRQTAQHLANGKVVGWFQGRMEAGPRALGNRSILADARRFDMKDTLNARVKFRESFRPFAPVVLRKDADRFFSLDESPYMMFTATALTNPIALPATTHTDRSARLQTVTPDQNARLVLLLKAFKALTACPVLLNTSFNVMGEPIVCSPTDALHTFMHSDIDILVLNNFIVRKA